MDRKYKLSYYNIFDDNHKIIFNSLTKAKAEFNNDLYYLIKNEELSKINNNDMNQLKEMGFVIEKDLNEFEIIKSNYIDFRNSKDTLLITLIPTFMCNFRCPYCFEGSSAKLEKTIIDYDILEKFIVNNFKKYKNIHITLFGGEPLITHEKTVNLFKRLQQYKNRLSTNIATNAFLLNENVIKELINDCNCQSFQITIDGCKRTHNSLRCLSNGNETFDTVLNNFKTLLKYNNDDSINIVLRVNLFNNSIDEVNDFLDSFSEEDKKHFSIYFRTIYKTKEFENDNKNNNNLKCFYNEATNKGFITHNSNFFNYYHCEGDGGEEQLHITPDLKIYKCINDLNFEKAYIGSIDKNGNPIFNPNLSIWSNYSVFEDDECRKCKYLPMCWGGCPLKYQKYGRRTCIYEKRMNEEIKKGD